MLFCYLGGGGATLTEKSHATPFYETIEQSATSSTLDQLITTDKADPDIYKVETSTGVEFHVKSAHGLETISQYTETGAEFLSTWKVVLDNNIDMTNSTYKSLKNFNGTFEGNGRIISNLRTSLIDFGNAFSVSGLTLFNCFIMQDDTYAYRGAVANIANGGVIIVNVKVIGCVIAQNNTAGGIIGQLNCSGEQVILTGIFFIGKHSIQNNIVIRNAPHIIASKVGGFVGEVNRPADGHYFSIYRSYVNCFIHAPNGIAGGMIGQLNHVGYPSGSHFYDNMVNVTIQAATKGAGCVGEITYDSLFSFTIEHTGFNMTYLNVTNEFGIASYTESSSIGLYLRDVIYITSTEKMFYNRYGFGKWKIIKNGELPVLSYFYHISNNLETIDVPTYLKSLGFTEVVVT